MPFRFHSANCIAAGTFNIYIVQPAWLADQGIVPKGEQVGIFSKLDEPGFRFSAPKMRSRWLVTPSRIEVSSKHPDEDCGALVGQVLERLKWTPLKAVGTNVSFRAPLEEQDNLKGFVGFRPAVPAGYSFEQRSLHMAVKDGGHVFNLQLSVTDEFVELAANSHTDTEKSGTELGQVAAKKHMEHRRRLEALIGEIFTLSVEYANPEPLPELGADGVPH